MAHWVGAQGQVKLAKNSKTSPHYDVTLRKTLPTLRRKWRTWDLKGIGLRSDPHLWSRIFDNDWKGTIPWESGRNGTLRKFNVPHFATKCAVAKFLKSWMSSNFSKLKDTSWSASAICPEISHKYWRGTCPAGCTQRKTAQTPSKAQVGWLHLRTRLVPSRCWAFRIIWDCCWPWGISSPSSVAAPAIFPGGETSIKMNEWINIFIIRFTLALLLLCFCTGF